MDFAGAKGRLSLGEDPGEYDGSGKIGEQEADGDTRSGESGD